MAIHAAALERWQTSSGHAVLVNQIKTIAAYQDFQFITELTSHARRDVKYVARQSHTEDGIERILYDATKDRIGEH